MEYISPMKKPMRGDPPGFRIMGSAWFEPDEHDGQRSPLYVVFSIAGNERRAFAVGRDEAGVLECHEYHEVTPHPDDRQTPYAARIDGSRDGWINCLGDPLDAWIAGGFLPKRLR